MTEATLYSCYRQSRPASLGGFLLLFSLLFLLAASADAKNRADIAVTTPHQSKHCSMIPITDTGLRRLLARYPLRAK